MLIAQLSRVRPSVCTVLIILNTSFKVLSKNKEIGESTQKRKFALLLNLRFLRKEAQKFQMSRNI
jgi:hypothetical protein